MNLRPLHVQAVVLASLAFACSSPEGALRYDPTSGAVRLTVNDTVLVDGVASAQPEGALAVSLDGGLSAGLELPNACTVLQDDLHLAPARDE